MIARYVLPLLAGALALIVLAEWVWPDTSDEPSARAADVRQVAYPADGTIISLGAAALAEKILARPLFLAGRHVPAPALVAPVVAVQKPLPPPPRLAGILVMSGTRLAVFQIAGQIDPVAAGIGDAVSAWTVTAIDADAVTIVGASGKQILTPTPDPAAAGIALPTGDPANGQD